MDSTAINIEVYSTTFFLGDDEKNAPGYLQIILLVYAAKMAETAKNGQKTAKITNSTM